MIFQSKRAYYKLFFYVQKKWAAGFSRTWPPEQTGAFKPQNNRGAMIQFVEVLLKLISEQGRDFKWPRPQTCPYCNHSKVWGHGYVSRLFDGFRRALLIKCYRCPECGRVFFVSALSVRNQATRYAGSCCFMVTPSGFSRKRTHFRLP